MDTGKNISNLQPEDFQWLNFLIDKMEIILSTLKIIVRNISDVNVKYT